MTKTTTNNQEILDSEKDYSKEKQIFLKEIVKYITSRRPMFKRQKEIDFTDKNRK